jgi:mono/diheme cytochrome c family protein
MPAVDASPEDMAALLAYLGALGTDAANVPATVHRESPPPFTFVRTSLPIASHASNDAASVGQQLFQEHACFACHGQDGAGGRAPGIAALIAKINDAQLTPLLGNPNDRMRAEGMPPFAGTAEQTASLISYLRTLPAPQRRDQFLRNWLWPSQLWRNPPPYGRRSASLSGSALPKEFKRSGAKLLRSLQLCEWLTPFRRQNSACGIVRCSVHDSKPNGTAGFRV